MGETLRRALPYASNSGSESFQGVALHVNSQGMPIKSTLFLVQLSQPNSRRKLGLSIFSLSNYSL